MNCPICGSSKVRGFKVHSRGAWWSECISEKDHGTFTVIYENGVEKELTFPKYPWFTFREDGSFLVEVQGKDYPFE